jgi:hypothetical protein
MTFDMYCTYMLTHHISMVVQTGSGAHPASYPIGTGGSFPGSKVAGGVADHSPPYNAEVNKGGAMTSLPHMSSWHGD